MCPSRSVKAVKVAFEASNWGGGEQHGKQDDLLPVSKDCLQQGKENLKKKTIFFFFPAVQPNDISFHVVAHPGLNGGSILRTFSQQGSASVLDLLRCFFLFFYTLIGFFLYIYTL